ncbi:MAG: hypothetical protein IPG74_07290 [Flavobacteriales bacterium]|nr:hypothetical protein [Flavobacteriales bacterium]MBK7555274.1 hypothetical protein [Flavobacteriales bacterium]MBK9195808.1 hypothetical protein [Flavobacteriales bacterium]MBP6574387.1 hypothetical protein [Flavobacteriales bacterium]
MTVLRYTLLIGCASVVSIGTAQPDSLFIPSGDTVYTYAVEYSPELSAALYTRVGKFAHDTTRVAVELRYQRGKPCGVYKAFYPDGKPLIFAVYGWGFLHGDWSEYDEFGRIAIKGQYHNGLREGIWAFRAQGIVGRYKEGKKHGKWKYYRNGRIYKTEKYHEDTLLKGSTYTFPGR